MAMKDALLPEFDHEMAVARKVLDRVADDKFAWQPHERSMSLGRLATHLAEIPQWAKTILSEPELNMITGQHKPSTRANKAEVLATFDASTKLARDLMAGMSDAQLVSTWSFKQDGKELFSMPRVAAWRGWVMNHLIHHRGQLSVYLRMTGAKVPGIYGPSADEN